MITTLKSLKLFGMADTVGNMATQASPAYQQAIPILETLLKAEVAEREVRSINYQMKAAKFPTGLSDKNSRLCTRKVIRSSPDPPHRAVCSGAYQPSVLHTTANATAWVVIRFPDRNPGSSFASACGTFRSSRTLPEFARVTPISRALPLSAPALN
mgnify:FL=1